MGADAREGNAGADGRAVGLVRHAEYRKLSLIHISEPTRPY